MLAQDAPSRFVPSQSSRIEAVPHRLVQSHESRTPFPHSAAPQLAGRTCVTPPEVQVSPPAPLLVPPVPAGPATPAAPVLPGAPAVPRAPAAPTIIPLPPPSGSSEPRRQLAAANVSPSSVNRKRRCRRIGPAYRNAGRPLRRDARDLDRSQLERPRDHDVGPAPRNRLPRVTIAGLLHDVERRRDERAV